MSRGLGIAAAGQPALHYWIASFGTLGNYASKLGLSRTAQSMRLSLEEARQADERHTAPAETMLDTAGKLPSRRPRHPRSSVATPTRQASVGRPALCDAAERLDRGAGLHGKAAAPAGLSRYRTLRAQGRLSGSDRPCRGRPGALGCGDGQDG